ncbi:hypothetical protein IEQ34_022979 [Dendrobium chrysotoxum]|uniref:protein-serine/threonine phosphatase n=1 Tax=Dendrobium chrysotoxum TaxID=161865 RepID=A0AAV7G0F3_DENCH|nr:hypothetical protein IEQ34_022979 [Dendrobium chrysotoxum]
MGSGASRHLRSCLRPSAVGGCGGAGEEIPAFEPGPLDETLGHSFCYVRSSSPVHSRSSSAASAVEIAFKAISGASVSANSSTILPIFDNSTSSFHSAGFQSSSSFSTLPLQLAGDLDRGFFLSGPIDVADSEAGLPYSGPLVKKRRKRRNSTPLFRRSFSEKNRQSVVPLRGIPGRRFDPDNGEAPGPSPASGNVQWAHGKAGEDRVHVVVSEEQKWLFVGIYDGFNGPEAPEFLVGNLYRSVFNELRGLFWEEVEESREEGGEKGVPFREDSGIPARRLREFLAERDEDGDLEFSGSGRFALSLSKLRSGFGSWRKKAKEIQDAPERNCCRRKVGPVSDHDLVLRALSRALKQTEIAYLEMTDRAMDCNPEMALMGSCLLVVLMRDEDVYVMNVGDSRAIVAQYRLQEGVEKGGYEVEIDAPFGQEGMNLGALQLSTDHNTSIPEEVLRIKAEHPDDSQCIVNDRVKGRLKVTRAFGAGYLKQPKWNNGLLEMFRNEFIGNAPYVSCIPSLCHHKLGPNDQFLVLSSDGLYQYLSNEEVVVHVERFIERFPDGDPAQSLIEELLFRAAKKAGMDFHELLDIPQGDRRKYHDDVTVMVISLEGRIWKSSGKYV